MKQNERLLVYAVTGFLALILVVAVLFSREPGKDGQSPNKPQGLDQILGQDGGKGAGDGKVGKEKANVTGLPGPDDVALHPLAAGAPKAMLAPDLVAQQLGTSRRDRTVRFVRAKTNDSLDLLVRRWCGARDPYLAEAKSLNEDLTVLHVGQEIAVPWVDDEVVLAAIEASKPKTLLAQDAVAGGNTPKTGTPEPANGAGPSFAQPGTAQPGSRSSPAAGDGPAHKPAISGGTSYTVKDKDNLWRIAERTYGKKNADRMIPAIKEANPGMTDALKVGQKIVLPAAPATGA